MKGHFHGLGVGGPVFMGEIKVFQPESGPNFRIGNFFIISQVSGMLSQGTLSPERRADGPR